MLGRAASSIGAGQGRGGFLPESLALVARFPVYPSEDRARFIDGAFVRPMVAMGLYAGLRAFYPFMVARDAAEALVDWGPAANDAQIVGTMVFDVGVGFRTTVAGSYVGRDFGAVNSASHSYAAAFQVGEISRLSAQDFNAKAGIGYDGSSFGGFAAQNDGIVTSGFTPHTVRRQSDALDTVTPIVRSVSRYGSAAGNLAYASNGTVLDALGGAVSATIPSGLQSHPNMAGSQRLHFMASGPGMTAAQLLRFNSLCENLLRNIPS